MKVCFPVQEDSGMDSMVYNHFGSAPTFIIVDTDENGAAAIKNNDMHHDHGSCNPFMAIGGNHVDAVVVGGIGGGALRKLNTDGIRVYRSAAATVKENIALFMKNGLSEMMMNHTCGGHQNGCAHH